MDKTLPREFYEPSASIVAPQLLGHWLIRQVGGQWCGGPIVETEAYVCDDPACHAFVGQTTRNRVMWGHPGMAYVYLIYGFHFCFNAVCCPKGSAEAVLVRAIEPAMGVEWMKAQRPVENLFQLTNGPGKLCAALHIDRGLDGTDLCKADSTLFIAQNPERKRFLKSRGPIVRTTRVGLTKAADWPLRFYLEQSAYISKKGALGQNQRRAPRPAG